jgi:hypothetical protein
LTSPELVRRKDAIRNQLLIFAGTRFLIGKFNLMR